VSRFGRGHERRIFSGEVARAAAEKLAAEGIEGVVVEVRFPPLSYTQTIHKSWREIRVRLNGGSDRYFVPHGVNDEPLVAEVAPGDVSIGVVNLAHERSNFDFVLLGGSVQVVVLFPQLTRLSFGQRKHEIVLGKRYRAKGVPLPAEADGDDGDGV